MLQKRCVALVKLLLESNKPLTTKELAEALSVSSRTVRYDLDDIDIWLVEQELPPVNRKNKVGIWLHLSDSQKEKLKSQLVDVDPYEYVYSHEERVALIIAELLLNNLPTNLKDLELMLEVSANTISRDLKEAEIWLKERNLGLNRRGSTGIAIQGDEKYKRKAIVDLYAQQVDTVSLLDMLKHEPSFPRIEVGVQKQLAMLFSHYSRKDINLVYSFVEEMEVAIDFSLKDSAFAGLVIHTLVSIDRLRRGHGLKMPQEQLTEIQHFPAFSIVQQKIAVVEGHFQVEFDADEIGYIAVHLLGTPQGEELDVEKVARLLILNVERAMSLHITNREVLIDGIETHLRAGLFRLRFGGRLRNPLLNNIRTRYPDIFSATKEACQVVLAEKYQLDVSDDEVAYIAMHFGAALEREKEHHNGGGTRALVVCSSGLGTAEILRLELQRKIPYLKIHDVVSYNQFSRRDKWPVDIIISTLHLTRPGLNIVQVNPLLSEADVKKIRSAIDKDVLPVQPMQLAIGRITDLAQRYGKVNDLPQFQKELGICLQELIDYPGHQVAPQLAEVVQENMIQLNYDAQDWRQAVRRSGELLAVGGVVTERYVDAMVESIERLGPYAVIVPGVALPHAPVEDGALKIGFSFVTLAEGVDFGNPQKDPVRLVIGMSVVDSSMHLRALTQLTRLITNPKMVEEVLGATTPRQVTNVVQRYYYS